jgi:hypothetical protein
MTDADRIEAFLRAHWPVERCRRPGWVPGRRHPARHALELLAGEIRGDASARSVRIARALGAEDVATAIGG